MSEVVWRPTPRCATSGERDAARRGGRGSTPSYRRELVRRARPTTRLVLAARDRGHGARVLRAVDGGVRRLARARVDDLVPRRQGLDRAQLRAPLGRAARPTRSRRSASREDGSRSQLTFAELSREVTRLAEALVRLGVAPGDRVALFLPMSPEAAIASHACAHIGAIQVPIFSGFAAPAVAQRLQASEAKVAITARESTRRGRHVPMLEILEEARREAPSVEHVIAAPWDELVADCPGELPALEVESETPYLLTYTSGTTGDAEGRRPRAGRLPRLDRARGLLPGRRARGRRRLLRDRHGLDHGPVDGGRRRRARRDGRLRWRARPTGRPTGSGRSSSRSASPRSASRRRSRARCSRTATRRTTCRRCGRS